MYKIVVNRQIEVAKLGEFSYNRISRLRLDKYAKGEKDYGTGRIIYIRVRAYA